MKLSTKLKKKAKPPQINLKQDDFVHVFPEDKKFEVIIHWKGKGFEPEVINPVHAVAKGDGKFMVINRNLMDTKYSFPMEDVLKVYLMPMEI